MNTTGGLPIEDQVVPGYTGGQYSLVRAAMGLFLMLHLTLKLPWVWLHYSNEGVLNDGNAGWFFYVIPNVLSISDSPAMVEWLTLICIGLCPLLMIGWYDRIAAGLLWYLLACFHARNPIAGGLSTPLIGWALLAHIVMPRAPFGALSARGRTSPRGDWGMPAGVFVLMWLLLGAGYFVMGIEHAANASWTDGTALYGRTAHPYIRPAWMRDIYALLSLNGWRTVAWIVLVGEFAFAPLLLFRRTRAIAWAWTLVFHQAIVASVIFKEFNVGVLMLHMLCFDPRWVSPRPVDQTDTVFYDGHCGMCHSWVRMILAEDLSEHAFRFSPLDGDTIKSALTAEQRSRLPDSVVVVTATGDVLTRSTAAIYVMHRLGGIWAIVGDFLAVMPRFLRDLVYDAIARVRYRLMPKPADVCPVMPAHWRSRFLS